MAGANSIFTGEKLLTTPNSEFNEDKVMFDTLGLIGKAPVFNEEADKRRTPPTVLESKRTALTA